MTQAKPAAQQNQASRRVILLAADHKRSVVAEVVDGTSNTLAYNPYGHQSAQQDVATRLGFTGVLRESKIGWYLLGNGYRAYNPLLMRFHSPDSWSPFGRGGVNAYMYCVGDPVNHSDPTGHSFVGALKLFFQENFSFGGSAAQLAASNAARRANGIHRQEAMHALGAAGGPPSSGFRPSMSAGVTDIGTFILGAPGPRGNRSPALQYVPTKQKSPTGRINTAFAITASRPSSSPPQASSPGRVMRSLNHPSPPSYDPPPSYDMAERYSTPATFANSQGGKTYTVYGMSPGGPANPSLNDGPPGGTPLPTTPPRPPSPTSSFDGSGPSDWSSTNSSRSSSPVPGPSRYVALTNRVTGEPAGTYAEKNKSIRKP